MADSDTISGIENLKSAVSGETPAYQYKDPNTDMMKAISKCIDAADGTIDDQYEYKNPNTDVVKKMDELAEAIAEGGGSSTKTKFRYLKWHITDNGNNNNVLQIAEVEFRNENNVAFTMPTGFVATSSMSPYNPEDDVYVLFDGTDRKLVLLPWVSGTSVEDITIDLGAGNYLDISEYPYFCWKSGGDDSHFFGRAPRIWQLYGANQSDFSDTVLLDDTTIPINTQNSIWAYKSRMLNTI